ncbi:MAG TPA: ergothioneine biosynthesis protein EgtB [Acidimicrobiales bacterium]|nr:ergothioneine biosynthesis protein EgtB [Acidimicrobiales bacterium]
MAVTASSGTASEATDVIDREALLDRYQATRDATERLAAVLAPEDQVVQTMPDVSPTKWHRAHVTWFFETFLLGELAPGHEPFHPGFGYLFNSYYEQVGERHPRAERGLISRPTVAEVGEYRRAVDAAMAGLVAAVDERTWTGLAAPRIELGVHHEQQHQELLLMDIKHVLSCNPLAPAYVPDECDPAVDLTPQGWVDLEGGLVEVGGEPDGFSFDNEAPRHPVFLQPYRLANRLVTNGEWLTFIDDGGYERAELWLSDGWAAVQAEGWGSPLHWRREGDAWRIFTLAGERPVDLAEPVCHVSHYEADAFARWAGCRLPLEAEWEHAVAGQAVEGNLLDPHAPATGAPHPRPAPAAAGGGVRQAFGDVWEWTSSPYVAYPGFRPAEGAIGEYNGKFMSNQVVLRGGSCLTPRDHVRPTYRNFFPPSARWQAGGLRLAADA